MKALDTNVVVRFLVHDDPAQGQRAKDLLAAAEARRDQFLVTDLVLLELMWVLARSYGLSRDELIEVIEVLAATPVFRFESYEMVIELIQRGRSSTAHLPDLLIGLRAASLGCDATLTFEKSLPVTGLFSAV